MVASIVLTILIRLEQKINLKPTIISVKTMTNVIRYIIYWKNILKYNHREKSMKISFVIYHDPESLCEKIDKFNNFHVITIEVNIIVSKTRTAWKTF